MRYFFENGNSNKDQQKKTNNLKYKEIQQIFFI